LKPVTASPNAGTPSGFQRTYEELKLDFGNVDICRLLGFQRTYEELKLGW